MAKHYETKLIDDLDGGDADETVQFGLDKPLEIDLSAKNAAKLRDLLAPYVAAARRASSGTRPATASRRGGLTAADRETNRAIREWATKRGMKIAERGRIPADVLAAYYDEGPGSGPRAVAS